MATPRRLPRESRPLLFAAALSLIVPLILPASRPLFGQDRQFPYEATVRVDGAYVRSGPGKSYYPTDRMARGTRLTVYRHDPGGWFMVAPPPGSFSWVRAEHVQSAGDGRGTVRMNSVVVRVGSTFGDETRDVEQIRLSQGDEISIIEQKTLQTEQGPIAFLKIAPPAGEYRWIAGQDVTAVDAVVRSEHDRNPFMTPSNASSPHAPIEQPDPFAGRQPSGPGNNQPIASGEHRPRPNYDGETHEPREPRIAAKGSANGLSINHSGPDPAVLASQRDRLDELDAEFRAMVSKPTGEWEFTQLEQGYRQLQDQAALPALANQIELRFGALERYQKIKFEYDDLMRLTNETRRRDAELLSLQSQISEPVPSLPSQPLPGGPAISEQPTTPFVPGGLQPEPDPGTAGPVLSQDGWVPSGTSGGMSGGAPFEPSPSRPASPLAGDPSTQPQPPQFDGAGIVQRTPSNIPGVPRHVLVAPGGRVLTYLQGGPGVNLDAYIGQSLGLTGQRDYQPDLRSDFMIVHGLTPVRLIP